MRRRPSQRELLVLQLYAWGRNEEQVAEQLHVSKHTIRTQVAHALTRMGVHNRTYAVALCMREGWIE